jgi:hypothetical protein
MLWPDEKRTRYPSVGERIADGLEGRRVRRIRVREGGCEMLVLSKGEVK